MNSHFSIKCQASSKVGGTSMYRCGLDGGISKDTVEEMLRQRK